VKKTPFFQFAEDADNLALHPRSVVIEQAIGKIDHAVVMTTRSAPASARLVADRPLSFRWGSRKPYLTRQQYAYMAGTSDVTERKGSRLTNTVGLRLMGTGMRLRDKKHRSWNNSTVPDVVQQICGEHRLNLVIDGSKVRWTRLVQDGVSDWTFIMDLAKKMGWWAYLDNTTLFVLDPDQMIFRPNSTPVIDLSGTSGPLNQRTDDNPLMGERRVATRTAKFTDQQTGRVYNLTSADRVPVTGSSTTGSTLVEEVVIDEESYPEAQAAFDGIVRNSSWYIERTFRLDGRTDLRPLLPVLVRTPRVRQAGNLMAEPGWEQYDGFWIIKDVCVRMDFDAGGGFTTDVTVVSDARGDTNVRQRRGTPLDPTAQPPTRLLNDTWVSAWRAA
jgi:hypothetical protein